MALTLSQADNICGCLVGLLSVNFSLFYCPQLVLFGNGFVPFFCFHFVFERFVVVFWELEFVFVGRGDLCEYYNI